MPSKSAPERSLRRPAALLLALLLGGGAVRCPAQASAAARLPQTEGPWPGITFTVAKVKRIDDAHVAVFVDIDLARTASRPVLVGHPVASIPSPIPGEPPLAQQPQSLDFAGSTLTIDGAAYHLAKPLVFLNPNFAFSLGPGDGTEIPLGFDAPASPPAPPGGRRPPSVATLALPESKPIPNVSVPGEPEPQPQP